MQIKEVLVHYISHFVHGVIFFILHFLPGLKNFTSTNCKHCNFVVFDTPTIIFKNHIFLAN